ncbi:MAG: hypothetical protein GY841_04650 [FCB group bacterium]|nr:hypothetical protein [FCB group bacterium]
MKKLAIFTVLTLIMMVAASSVSARVITVRKTQRIGSGHLIKWQEYRTDRGVAVKHGLYVEKLDGKVILRGEYRHGRRHGEWTRWSTNGRHRKIETMIYKNGRLMDFTRPIYSKKYSRIVKIKRPPVVRVTLPHFRVHCRL